MTGLDYVTAILRRLGVCGAVETPSADDAAYVLDILNGILDDWNAESNKVYADTLAQFTTTPSLSPHTIGASGGTWTLTPRPEELLSAHALESDGSRTPLAVYHGIDWWAARPDPATEGDPPFAVCYVADWPLGQLYFYPVPSAARVIELVTRVVLTAMDLTTDYSVPPGYQNALVLTGTEQSADAFHVQVSPLVVRDAARARGRVGVSRRTVPGLSSDFSGTGGYEDIRAGRIVPR